jgi:hypothetical protein
MKDLHHNIKTVQTLDPAVTTDDRAGAPVDVQGFESIEHIVLFGASGDTLSDDLKTDVKLEASDNGSDWSPVTDEAHVLGGTVTEAGVFVSVDDDGVAQSEHRIGYVGPRRYSRVNLTLTGSHENGTPVAALAVLSHAHVKPVA